MSLKIPKHWVSDPISQKIFHALFPDSPIKNTQGPFTYTTHNDFGKVIRKLLFCKPCPDYSKRYFRDISEIAAIEGFTVKQSNKVYPVRDPGTIDSSGEVLLPLITKSHETAMNKLFSRIWLLQNHASVLTHYPNIFGSYLGNVALKRTDRQLIQDILPKTPKQSGIYLEGGNTFYINNANNTPTWVIGEDHLSIAHQTLRLEKKLANNTKIQELAKKIAAEISDKEILKTLDEMQALKWIPPGVALLEKNRETAIIYLAERRYIQTEVIPSELGASIPVHFLPQGAYHIDLMLAPGPKGSVFLQDFELSLDLLKTIQQNAEGFKLCETDLDQLAAFIQTTEKMGKELRPLYDKAKQELKDAGMHTIPTPGAFFYFHKKHRTKQLHINFLNCITGYSRTTKHYYMISPGATHSAPHYGVGRIGEILMDAFNEFIRSKSDEETVVYFAGSRKKDPRDFTEAMETLKQHNLGLHCLSLELDIDPHTT